MINVIPKYLEDAVKWLERKFPDDPEVNLSILYGFDSVSAGEDAGAAVYNTDSRTIFLADPEEERKACDLSVEDMQMASIMNQLDEYCKDQQNVYGKPFSEEEAEMFALECYQRFITVI